MTFRAALARFPLLAHRPRRIQHGRRQVSAAWVARLLLGAALLTGATARAEERYFAHTSMDDQVPRHTHASAGGFLYASTGEWQFGISGLLATGLVTEAYMTTRSRPIPGEVSVLPFLAPHDRNPRLRLSAVQVRHLVEGDWVLVVKSSGFAAGRFVGHADLRNEDEGIPGTYTPGHHTIRWAVAGQGGREGPTDAAEPFATYLHFDRPAGTLCLRMNFSNDRTEREPVAAYFQAPDGRAAPAPVMFRSGPEDGYREACSQAPATLTSALAAGGMQVTVTTASAPAREFVGRFDVSRDDTPGSLSRLGTRLGRSLSPLPDLH